MYQSHLRRDLEKRIEKSRKMYIVPFGIVAIGALIISVIALIKSNEASSAFKPRSESSTSCNRSVARHVIKKCNFEANKIMSQLPMSNFTIQCCVQITWKSCVDEVLTTSGCINDRELEDYTNSFSETLFYVLKYVKCEKLCKVKVETTTSANALPNFTDVNVIETELENEVKPVSVRKPKKWNGPGWDDTILSDNDTLDADESLESDVNEEVFKRVLNVSDLEDDSMGDETTTMTFESTTNLTTSDHDSVSTDEITLLLKSEEENDQEEDSLTNETSIDTSDIKPIIRNSRKLDPINSAELINVNLFLALINTLIYICLINVE